MPDSRPPETIFDLVRHAHAHWTPDDMRPLSAAGQRAAQHVADRLTDPSDDLQPISLIVSSPSLRARQTVTPLAARLGLPIIIDPRLVERRLGIIAPDDHAFRAAVHRTWDTPEFRYPGGESNREAQRRGLAVIEALKHAHPHEHIAIATHGNLLALIVASFDPAIDFDFWSALTMPDIYRLRNLTAQHVGCRRLWQPRSHREE